MTYVLVYAEIFLFQILNNRSMMVAHGHVQPHQVDVQVRNAFVRLLLLFLLLRVRFFHRDLHGNLRPRFSRPYGEPPVRSLHPNLRDTREATDDDRDKHCCHGTESRFQQGSPPHAREAIV